MFAFELFRFNARENDFLWKNTDWILIPYCCRPLR